jgi:FAD/FMN-containing dehydrogenase/Fe-S oxidoreductase
VIVDLSKYLNRIIEINIDQEYAICEPGVVQDNLNNALASFGYRLGPDTSTGNRATLGGMLANNSAGAHSLHYGRMVDHVEGVELALAGGRIIECKTLDERAWQAKTKQNDDEGHIYREMARIQNQYQEEIQKRFPKVPRRSSGYNLDQLLSGPPINLSKLVCGSEGTLGIASQIKIKIAKTLRHTGLCLIHTQDMLETMNEVETMLAFGPISLEMIDSKILEMALLSRNVRSKIGWLQGNPDAVFIAEFEGGSEEESGQKLSNFANRMKALKIGYACDIIQNPQTKKNIWEVRKTGLGLLLSKRTYNRAIAFIEDLSVPPDQLATFMKDLCNYLKKMGKEAGIYGHVGSGCMHIRPYVDLRKPEEMAMVKQIMLDVADMVLAHSGVLSGEHGDGLIRTWLNKKMFGEKLYQAFVELKAAFDPRNLMNPGKVVHGPPVTQNLRLSPDTKQTAIPTFLDFSEEGGFELAADLCNGNGQCRKGEKLMCPSFQATLDEYDTTRARAQSLRSIINGRLPKEEFTGRALYDVLDLCLECKGCKRECPSQVDMAKMKAEFLYQYQEKHGYPLRSRLFGHIDAIFRFGFPLRGILNSTGKSHWAKKIQAWLGIASERELPVMAPQRFSTWFRKHAKTSGRKKVALFNDTYTEFIHPEIGSAAYNVLSALGYDVVLISGKCCGRPLISKGMLHQAKAKAQSLVAALFPLAQMGCPITGLEPSCLFAIKDDFKGLIGTGNSASTELAAVIEACTTLDEFLYHHLENKRLPLNFAPAKTRVLVHGHCHQKALIGGDATLDVLSGVPGFDVHEIASGCCGVAGSFGYEQEHYDISMKIGNLHLLPAVKNATPETLIVANGTSCRSQIQHGAGRRALHLAEAVAKQMSISQ